ncbi:MAG: hypothetical protein KJ063_02835 [Anaerolineae bacterium]|nr:hypothetical protein [Anaerolineae bacterium]
MCWSLAFFSLTTGYYGIVYWLLPLYLFAEIFRCCRPGAHVAFVNDNVRYGGEIIPVDLLTTDLAAALGFEPVTVYVLPQRKGNSSQQMGRFGRVALRKTITIWRKPKKQHGPREVARSGIGHSQYNSCQFV